MERKTKAQLEAMGTPELVALFNELAAISCSATVNRFASKAKGVERILKWYENNPALAAPAAPEAQPLPADPPPHHENVRANVRTVSPMSVRAGRPPSDFIVCLAASDGTARVRDTSLRGKIMARLRANGGSLSILKLEEEFGRKARGAVMKLMVVKWVEKTAVAS